MTLARTSVPLLARISPRAFSKTNKNEDTSKTKHVRFACKSKKDPSSVKAQYIEPSYQLTDEVCEQIWLSYDERIENDLERRFLAQEFRHEKGKTEIDSEFEHLYENCSTMSLTQVLRSDSAKQVLFEIASNESLRGLEGKLSRTVSKRRKYHIGCMLSICSFESEIPKEDLPDHLRQTIRASEIMARAIAVVDAKMAC